MVAKMKGKKRLILDSAKTLFPHFGLKKTTVDEIARLAKIGKGTIYRYFASKEDIFLEVIEEEGKILQNQLHKAINKVVSPQEKLRIFVFTWMKALKKLANYYNIFKEEYIKQYPFIQKVREKNFEREMDIVKSILEEGVKKGIFNIDDVKRTSRVILNAIRGMEYSWIMKKSEFDFQQSIKKFIDLLIKGLEKREGYVRR